MKSLYQRTFEQLRMSEEKAGALRAELVSRGVGTETEVTNMNKMRFLKRPVGVLAAAIIVCALCVTAFAYGGQIVTGLYQMMSGGSIEQGIDENGIAYASGCADIDNALSPIELRDGRMYLVVNGENIDITGKCSYTEPYIYECTGEDGLRHVFVIGGEPSAIGWTEFIWDADGLPVGGNSQFGASAGRDDAPWLDAAMDELGLPW